MISEVFDKMNDAVDAMEKLLEDESMAKYRKRLESASKKLNSAFDTVVDISLAMERE